MAEIPVVLNQGGNTGVGRSRAPRCIGYATFLTSRKPPIDVRLDSLREDIKQMAVRMQPFESRLVNMQHSFIDLLEFLDPGYVRFPKFSCAMI